MEPLIGIYQGISAVVTNASASSIDAQNKVKHEVGDRIVKDSANYVYAFNADANTAIAPGLGCAIESGATSYSVVLSASTLRPSVGYVVHATAVTDGFFWMLLDGVNPQARLSGTTAAPGLYLFPAAGGGLTITAPTGLTAISGTTAALAVGEASGEIATESLGQVLIYK